MPENPIYVDPTSISIDVDWKSVEGKNNASNETIKASVGPTVGRESRR